MTRYFDILEVASAAALCVLTYKPTFSLCININTDGRPIPNKNRWRKTSFEPLTCTLLFVSPYSIS